MRWRRVIIFNFELGAEISEFGIVEGGILLNHAMAGPFRVVANALHLTGLDTHAIPFDSYRC